MGKLPTGEVALFQEKVSPVSAGSCCPRCDYVLTWSPGLWALLLTLGVLSSAEHSTGTGKGCGIHLEASMCTSAPPTPHPRPAWVCRDSQQAQGTALPHSHSAFLAWRSDDTLKMARLQESEHWFQFNVQTKTKQTENLVEKARFH